MISDLAFIHPDASLGKDVSVEAFAHIAGDVVIGDGSWIGPNATVMDGARMGKNCRVFPGAVISAIPQDLKFVGEKDITASLLLFDFDQRILGKDFHIAFNCLFSREFSDILKLLFGKIVNNFL